MYVTYVVFFSPEIIQISTFKNEVVKSSADDAPADIAAHGPTAVRAYQSACEASGTRAAFRVNVVIIGRDATARKRLHGILTGAR